MYSRANSVDFSTFASEFRSYLDLKGATDGSENITCATPRAAGPHHVVHHRSQGDCHHWPSAANVSFAAVDEDNALSYSCWAVFHELFDTCT